MDREAWGAAVHDSWLTHLGLPIVQALLSVSLEKEKKR